MTSDPTTTANSGIRPGFLVGQQFDQNGVPLKDRKGNPLSFTPDIAPTMIETGSNLEVTGIRVVNMFRTSLIPLENYYSSNPGNWFNMFRYPDVVLMVAEALMRQATPDNAAALVLVNALRTASGASTVASLPLDPSANAHAWWMIQTVCWQNAAVNCTLGIFQKNRSDPFRSIPYTMAVQTNR